MTEKRPWYDRFYARLTREHKDYVALNELDKKLLEWLDFKGGFFVEAGANDGINQSNTYFLEKRRKWKGVLVEPIPELARICQKRRKHSTVFSCALGPPQLNGLSISMTYCGLMSIVDGGMKSITEQRQHIRLGMEMQEGLKPYELNVPCRTLESVLTEAGVKSIDFMSLDVEGYELSALQGLNLNKYKPRYLLVECRYEKEIREYLAPHYDEIAKLSYYDILFRARLDGRTGSGSLQERGE